MFFRLLGSLLARHWKLVLLSWGLAFLALIATAPAWKQIVRDGEFVFLPPTASSQVGEAEYRKAFSHDLRGSTAVIVVQRAGREAGLLPRDREFVETTLKPALLKIVQSSLVSKSQAKTAHPAIRTARDRMIGRLLDSSDGKTTLVLIELNTRFLDRENWPILAKIETLIAQQGELVGQGDNLFARQMIPPGLDLSLSGPATVGRDVQQTSAESSATIWQWALFLGVVGLLVFYRAPLLAFVPAVSVLASVGITFAGLSHLAGAGWGNVFVGLENYLGVVLASAGVMMGLMFIARINESRFQHPSLEEAITKALTQTGPALLGGSAILLASWGMLIFAQFGKFHQLGWALLIGIGVVFLASVTLVPALLLLLGRWAFWPNQRSERISADQQTWSLPRNAWSRWMEPGWSRSLWALVWRSLTERPNTLLWIGALVLLPFVLTGLLLQGDLSYGLLSQLPAKKASVKGAEIIQAQFHSGTTGPVTLLIEHPQLEFWTVRGKAAIGEFSDALEQQRNTFGIADIRSVMYPLGIHQKEVGTQSYLRRSLRHRKAVSYFVANQPPAASHTTKLEIVLEEDPFSRSSIQQIEALQKALPQLMPRELADAKWHMLGAPASIRDLKVVTDRDKLRINLLVLVGVCLTLFCLGHRMSEALAMLGLAVVNVLASFGITFAAFWVWNPDGFTGLDWKVPILLFVILIGFSLTSHWLLLERIRKEQKTLGPIDGLQRAMEQEGSVLWGAWLISAGLFAALWGASLSGLKQLGFALVCGMLWEALLIRPLLIPAWLLRHHQTTPPSENNPTPQETPTETANTG